MQLINSNDIKQVAGGILTTTIGVGATVSAQIPLGYVPMLMNYFESHDPEQFDINDLVNTMVNAGLDPNQIKFEFNAGFNTQI